MVDLEDYKKILLIDGIKYMVKPSNKKDKKYDVFYVYNNKDLGGKSGLKKNEFMTKYLLSFGAKNMEHYFDKIGFYEKLNHLDEERKRRYILRHQNVGNINDVKSAAFWSMWFLWGDTKLL
jgi:hypothetical protein